MVINMTHLEASIIFHHLISVISLSCKFLVVRRHWISMVARDCHFCWIYFRILSRMFLEWWQQTLGTRSKKRKRGRHQPPQHPLISSHKTALTIVIGSLRLLPNVYLKIIEDILFSIYFFSRQRLQYGEFAGMLAPSGFHHPNDGRQKCIILIYFYFHIFLIIRIQIWILSNFMSFSILVVICIHFNFIRVM